jgi:hypothetical protein
MSWLDPVCHVLDNAAGPVTLFFRDDDGGWDDDRLFRLLDIFETASIPVDLALIPAEVSDNLARRLNDRLRSSAGRIRVHQHGYRHTNHESTGKKCEFGPTRGTADQAQDLRAGQRRLVEVFPDFYDPIFTPPWNRCTQTTVDILTVSDHQALSRNVGARQLRLGGLSEIPVCVDWCGWQKHPDGQDRISQAIAARAAARLPIGLMLHHAVMRSGARDDVAALLEFLSDHPKARCVPMRSLIARRNADRPASSAQKPNRLDAAHPEMLEKPA